MRGQKRLSPFQQLIRAIEGELLTLSVQCQTTPAEELKLDYVLGYRCALNVLLERAYAIYNRQWLPGTFELDECSESASETLISALKERH